MNMRLAVSPVGLARALLATILILGALSFAANVMGSEILLHVFHLDAEANVPTWYSSITLLLCAVMLAVIGRAKREVCEPYVRHWNGLALVFLYLSIDEAAGLHDGLNAVLTAVFQPSGFLNFPWVLPASLAVASLGIVYMRWFRHLPAWAQARFLLAGIIYLAGAVGCEVLGAILLEGSTNQPMTYVVISHLEELLEMAGVAFFLHGLVLYAENLKVTLSFEIASAREASIPNFGGVPGRLCDWPIVGISTFSSIDAERTV